MNKANAATSLAEFLANAKGKTINFGSAGVGSGSHIAAEYFFREIAKVPATHVPFQGGAPAINAAVGNHIDLLSITLGGGPVAQVRSGTLKGLGVMTDTRVGAMKDLRRSRLPRLPCGVMGRPVRSREDARCDRDKARWRGRRDRRTARLPGAAGGARLRPVTGNQAAAAKRFKEDVGEWAKRVNALGLKIE